MRYYETQTTERIGYDFYCDIANRIVEARGRKGWTLEKLSEVSGISKSKLARIEAIQIKIKLEDIENLSKVLDVTVNWLIDAEIDSQIGDCLYLVWPEFCSGIKLYQEATSKRLAFLFYEKWLNTVGVRATSSRKRTFVKLVGVPITNAEIKDKFPKLPLGDEEIEPDEKPVQDSV